MKNGLLKLGLGLLIFGLGCGPTYVRDTDVDGLDDAAMSTGLDRTDLDRLFAENLESLFASGLARSWAEGGASSGQPSVALVPFLNETSEHVDSQLEALLTKLETQLINQGDVIVLNDPEKARFVLTGKAYDAAEKTADARRVQYFLFMQVVDTESGAIRWQNEAALTKALVR